MNSLAGTKTGATPSPAFVHVDLDGIWTLAGVYGFPERDLFHRDAVFDIGIERLIRLFEEFDIKATFFVVGRDLECERKRTLIRTIAAAGHELANHSYHHRLDLELLDDPVLQIEIDRTTGAIESLTGRRPVGFRAPGYAAGARVLDACSRAGLRYDGSCLPTRWGGVLRRLAAGLRRRIRRGERVTQGEVAGAGLQYGGLAFRGDPFAPEVWEGDAGRLLRLPLAVSPVLRLPLHASLGMLMGTEKVRKGLVRLAKKGLPLTYLLHGLDVIGSEDLPALPSALAGQRSFAMAARQKADFLRVVLGQLRQSATLDTTENWLRSGAKPWLDT